MFSLQWMFSGAMVGLVQPWRSKLFRLLRQGCFARKQN